MTAREKQLGFGGGKSPGAQGSWLVGLFVGITVSNMAAGAIMLGTSTAIGKAIIGRVPPRTLRRPG
jgi:hypothetical protein